ncbi:sensor histidine kinase [Methylotuvimicrobium buryatense]|nr:ATP-binding protein [Methylotuvimicrobium buryatense]
MMPSSLPYDSDKSALERYVRILDGFINAKDNYIAEDYLTEAFELGRELARNAISPDEVVGLHDEALIQLSHRDFETPIGKVVHRLSKPLLEMSMAYGLAFREQIEQRYEAFVNERLLQSNKLEAIGTLAAGIAHDFNNIIGSIIGFAEMTGDLLADSRQGQENIRQISIACSRAHDLVVRMLSFARQIPATPILLDIADPIREALTMLSVTLDACIQINFSIMDEHLCVMADPGQIQQLIMNLCINAAESMMPRGGRIDIEVGLARGHIAGDFSKHCNNNIYLLVADTGSGMPPEIQKQIFDPFFTTKAPSGGSGLGLSVVYGIVKSLGGMIEVGSRSTGGDTGTEFRVFLPRAASG